MMIRLINGVRNVLMYSAVLTADDILKPAKTLVSLLEAGVAIWGVILIVKNVSEFATALKNQDDATMSSAVKGFIGGLLMAGIGTVLTFLGINV